MDLYKLFRLALYALAACGALALSIAEGRIIYLLAVLGCAAAAHWMIDSGREQPVREHLVGALALVLLIMNFLPMRLDQESLRARYLSSFAHYLFCLQLVIFFVRYRDILLLLSGCFTLAIVLITGILDPSATLLLRMACFVVVAAWTLFVHSLWRAREGYSGRGRRAAIEPASLLSERAFWQGLSLTGALSAVCIALGLFLFFSAPRVNESVTAWLDWALDYRRPVKAPANGAALGRDQNDPAARGGPAALGNQIRLKDLDPIHKNYSLALTVTFSSLDNRVAYSSGYVLLRGIVCSRYDDGVWSADSPPFSPGDPQSLADVSAPGLSAAKSEFQQTVRPSGNLLSPIFFTAGPATRISGATGVAIDSEGVLHEPEDKPIRKNYEIGFQLPVHARDVNDDAEAIHPNENKYLDDGLRVDARQRARDFARTITRGQTSPIRKVRAVLSHLRDSKRYAYTLDVDQIKRHGDPIADFLLSEDRLQRRGHCGFFATAFVALCRLNKIPARLATGFAAPLPKDGSGDVLVHNSDAHAWSEVYFKDIGWVAFDPTPPSPEAGPAVAAASGPRAAPAPAGDQPDVGAVQKMWKNVLQFNGQKQRAIYERLGDAMRGGFGSAATVFTGQGIGGWFGAAVAWVAAVLFLWYVMQAYLRRGRRRAGKLGAGATRAHAALSFYNDLLAALSRRGFVRRPGQTPREFADFVVRHGGGEYNAVLLVTQVFESVRYGGQEITQDDFNRLQDALDKLRELTFAPAASGAKA